MQVATLIWKGITIVPLRLAQQGFQTTWRWLYEKFARMRDGVSPAQNSQVNEWLIVGGQHYPRGLEQMRARKIGATLNLREESDDSLKGVALARHLWLPTPDDGAPTLAQLKDGVAFIREAVKAKQAVYIHCAQGVGRAPTMAAAYLVSEGDTPTQAWAKIRAVRPFITPTIVQVERLDEWAKSKTE